MKITIRKIAQLAGVSRGTVDRVVNGRPGVKPEVREHVQQIIQEQNFIPNIAAKALAYNKKPINIGIVLPRDVAFFEEIRKGIDAASLKIQPMGVRIEFRYFDNHEPSDAVEAIKELLELGVSGMMVSAMNDPHIQSAINEVADKNIPVFTFNSDVTNCKRLCFVGQDLYKSGQVAAGLMAKIVPAGSSIIVIAGNIAFQAHKDRVNGFIDVLHGMNRDYRIASVIETFDQYSETFQKVNMALNKHQDIQGIYLAAGHAGACADVIQQRGLFGRIRLICNDMLPDVVKNMKNGIIDFTIGQDPFSQGYQPLIMLYEYIFQGKEPEQESIFTEISIKITENL